MNQLNSDGTRKPQKLERAINWLRMTLSKHAMAATEVFELAKSEGLSEKTVRRASKAAGVRKVKCGMIGGWRWIIPQSWVLPRTWPNATRQSGHLRAGVQGYRRLLK